ncbi:MAG: ABC transporter permease [Endomicrobium sp.]|jgi:macrolide transport system ATP-binding/permease protein|nr:ABC transporter permease [Endomicrobium sp.]
MKIIKLKNIKKTYLLEKLEVPVLHGIDLEITQGEFVAIVGHSGSGKSTLLNILGLLDKPSEGSYKLANVEVSRYCDNELAALRNYYLGFVFQQFNLLSNLTVLENVTLPTIYSSKNGLHEDPVKLLNMVGLSDRLNHCPNEISGGQQQRVAIARALINKPLIIFADEPTGNLDTKSTKEIINILKNLNDSGITVIMVTHKPDLTTYATRIITVQDGLIISDKKTVEKTNNSKKQTDVFKHKTFSFTKMKDYFVEATRALKSNKARSILSILGVMIGVASLIVVLAVGMGAKKSVQEQFENLGSNLLIVCAGAPKKGGISIETDTYMGFKIEDVYDLKRNVAGIKAVVGYTVGRAQVVANGKNHNTVLEGVSPEYADVRNSHPSSGTFFTEAENIEKKKVVLLGKTVINEIYGDENYNPIGEYIKINRIDFQVIGILPVKGSSSWRDEDDKILIPLNTALKRILGTVYLNYIDVQVSDDAHMNEVSESIITRLLFTHRMPASQRDAIKVWDMVEIQETMSQTTKAFSILLGSIGFISLLVGGIGIMNIMFVSVSERTKEIGLKKAIGANNTDILFQFIIESIFGCCGGGFVGIIFGSIASILVSKFAGWSTVITTFSIALAFCFSGFTGLIFGVWPARKAAKLSPIEALRYE